MRCIRKINKKFQNRNENRGIDIENFIATELGQNKITHNGQWTGIKPRWLCLSTEGCCQEG